MAKIYNQSRALGVTLVPEGARFYNNQAVIGIRDVGAAQFGENLRVVEADLVAGQTIYNEQPVVGAVLITDGRKFFNDAPVLPVSLRGWNTTRNSYSRTKARLAAGTDATMLVIGDSTAYTFYNPYCLMAQQIGDLYDCTVIVHQWAEWVDTAATGPKVYGNPVTLRTGHGPKLNLYLASLPGDVAACMFDTSRRGTALGAVSPDVVILHHGHNMQKFEDFGVGIYTGGRGMFFAAVGAISMQFPSVPQAICSQNPWRLGSDYAKVYSCQTAVASTLAGLTLVDSYAVFNATGKPAILYRADDPTGVHPSDSLENHAGAQLIAGVHFSIFLAARLDLTATTEDWTSAVGTNLISNGKMSDWTAAAPVGFQAVNNATVTKDLMHVYNGEPWSASISPNIPTGNQNSCLGRGLNSAERATVAGKRVTVAVRLTHAQATQRRPYAVFGVKDDNGVLRTHIMTEFIAKGSSVSFNGDYWLVATGISVGSAAATDGNTSIRVFPAFGATAPAVNDSISVAEFIIVEGDKPVGRLA